MKSFLLAAAALIGLTTGAMAADLTVGTATFDWSGAYIGANVGGGWDRTRWIEGTIEPTGSGVLGGLQIGYNLQNGNFVYGLEADIDAAGIKETALCPNPSFSCDSKVSMLGSVRGRLGWATDRLLIYGTGGLGYGTVDVSTVDSIGNTFGSKKTRAGWTLGAGTEYAFDQHWTVKAEYKYFDLGTAVYEIDPGEIQHINTKIHTAVIGLNYKF